MAIITEKMTENGDYTKMRVAFHTLGCKVNQYETEAMKEQFRDNGFEIVDEKEAADVYIVNTCTVTNMADRKSRQFIRRARRVSPNAVVCVTGCYSQVKPEELEAMSEVDIVTGNGEKQKLLGFVLQALKDRKKIVKILPYDELTEYNDCGIITSMENRTRAYIKIQEGCDRFCSYCMIPFARGHVRSRDPEEIIKEAKTLIEKGFCEIVLTGINTALYGTESGFDEKFILPAEFRNMPEPVIPEKIPDFPENRAHRLNDNDLSGLGMEYIISKINEIPGKFRIRLSSLEPTVVNADYIGRLLKYDKLCHHVHLSIQSGSDRIIEKMNRHYTRDEYLDIVKTLREKDPEYGITTDIIVGFPDEKEEDFLDSIDIVDKAGFAKVHVFKYSKRKGTKAEKMLNQVPDYVKNDRSDRLIKKAEQAEIRFAGILKGKTREAVFEEEIGDMAVGYTDNYVRVYAPKKAGMELNKILKVKLLEIYKDGMKGEIQNG